MLKDSIPENSPCILVEGPRCCDNNAFYFKWQRAAAKANALLLEAINDDSFEDEVFEVIIHHAYFSIGGTILDARLMESPPSFVVRPRVIEFLMMVEMGFLVRTGERYQMVIPSPPTMAKVRRAALKAVKLAKTEDEQCYRHLEDLVTTMTYAEAKAWQARLHGMDQDQRCADRQLLLETPSDFKIARPAALRVRREN